MFDFRRTNTLSQGCKGTVRGRMRVATDHGHSRHGRALLRPNDVNDALTGVQNFKLLDTKRFTVFV